MVSKKDIFYEQTTHTLICHIDKMGLDKTTSTQVKQFITIFRNGFKLKSVKYAVYSPDLGTDWRGINYHSYGFCRAASLSFYYLMDSKDWDLMYCDFFKHYYLRHKKSGVYFDITYDQYSYHGVQIPYEYGRKTRLYKYDEPTINNFLNSLNIQSRSL